MGGSVGGPFCSWSTEIMAPGIPFNAVRIESRIGCCMTGHDAFHIPQKKPAPYPVLVLYSGHRFVDFPRQWPHLKSHFPPADSIFPFSIPNTLLYPLFQLMSHRICIIHIGTHRQFEVYINKIGIAFWEEIQRALCVTTRNTKENIEGKKSQQATRQASIL